MRTTAKFIPKLALSLYLMSNSKIYYSFLILEGIFGMFFANTTAGMPIFCIVDVPKYTCMNKNNFFPVLLIQNNNFLFTFST